MPLSINVGLSRKASRDYQSAGISINVVAELDATLLSKPDELQRQIDDLYSQAQQAMDRQSGQSEPASRTGYSDRRPARDTGYSRSNGNGNSSGHRRTKGNGNGHTNGGGMTVSQGRAIDAISRRLNIDPVQEALDVIGCDLRTLSVKQASDLIDHLKSLQPANGNGNGH
jgi:hypothetical protein